MILKIIPADNYVSIDGVVRKDLSLTGLPNGVHAVQWAGDSGHIEWTTKVQTTEITTLKDFQGIIDAFNVPVPVPEITPEEQAAIDAREARIAGIVAAKNDAGLQGVTIDQAYNFIDNQIDSATNTPETVEAIRTILKKMVPYIL